MGTLATTLTMALLFALPLLFWLMVWVAFVHGPVPHRFWRGERWYGFASFVALLAFLPGFIGPMLFAPGSNQGPLLGLLITGPLGVLLGVVWGLARAASRAKSTQ